MTNQPEPIRYLSRIRQAWAATDDAAERLAELHMEPVRFRAIIDGQQRPNSLDLAIIAEACRTTVYWLLGGKPPREPFREPVDHRHTAAPLDPARERAATQRAIQRAAESEKSAAWFAELAADGQQHAQQRAATLAADMCPRCKGDNAEEYALCGTCEAQTPPDPEDDESAPCKGCGEPWHKRHTCAARTTPDNPATSDGTADNGLRELYAAAIVAKVDGTEGCANGHRLADAVLAVRDAELQQLAAEVQRLGDWARAVTIRAETAEAARDRVHDELTTNEADRVAAVRRAEDAEAKLTDLQTWLSTNAAHHPAAVPLCRIPEAGQAHDGIAAGLDIAALAVEGLIAGRGLPVSGGATPEAGAGG